MNRHNTPIPLNLPVIMEFQPGEPPVRFKPDGFDPAVAVHFNVKSTEGFFKNANNLFASS
ncbi:MAG: hypothetical protein Tsb0017_07240 [Geothermobacteraceae bacterium]